MSRPGLLIAGMGGARSRILHIAIRVAITGMYPEVLIAVVLSIVLLSLIHHFFKPYLRDLT